MSTENMGNEKESKDYAKDYDKNLRTGKESNDAVRKEIYRLLGEESEIDVHVHEGIVTLTGNVDNKGTRTFAAEEIKRIKGVDKVINELKVKLVV